MDVGDIATQGGSVLGVVGLVVGLLVWAIKRIVDMLDKQLSDMGSRFEKLGDRVVAELAKIAGRLEDVADRVEAIEREVTPTPRGLYGPQKGNER